MMYKELSDTVKRRMRYVGVCPLCNQPVTELDDISYLTYVTGRHKYYTFFHTSCLMKARNSVNEGRV